jgi:hypothetical protein
MNAIREALIAVRQRDDSPFFIGVAELYCRNGDCPVRTIAVELKEDAGETPADLRCPACRRRLAVHHVRTRAEQASEDEAWARCSVNAQLWRQRNPDAFGVPLGMLLDDRLPQEAHA